MTNTPNGKVQMNVYVPKPLNRYVDMTCSATGLKKSEFLHLILSYIKANYTHEDIVKMHEMALLFGEPHLPESHNERENRDDQQQKAS
jgi:hypothetical protein